MADHQYQLNIRIKTPAGEELAGQFFLGNAKDSAYELFDQLEGHDIAGTASFIYFEFVEMENNLPVNLKMIACDLEQAGRNIKMILKQLFKSSLLL